MAIRFMELLREKVSSEAVRPKVFLSLLEGQEAAPILGQHLRLEEI